MKIAVPGSVLRMAQDVGADLRTVRFEKAGKLIAGYALVDKGGMCLCEIVKASTDTREVLAINYTEEVNQWSVLPSVSRVAHWKLRMGTSTQKYNPGIRAWPSMK